MNRAGSLFISKKRIGYNGDVYNAFGLKISVNSLVEALRDAGEDVDYVEVVDANSIDREVYYRRPRQVILEALWVTPEKLKELIGKHPRVEWVIRLHSKIPFLGNEGVALQWLFDYEAMGARLGFNHDAVIPALSQIFKDVSYLPNMYAKKQMPRRPDKDPYTLDIGCFGAIRPLKNQLQQAVAAKIYADSRGKYLRFHINSGRVEQSGERVLKNIRELFEGHYYHDLIEHGWYTHGEFLKVMNKMDIHLQVSYSETFNIVTADAVSVAVPVVVSPEIDWVPSFFHADPNSVEDIVSTMGWAERLGRFGTLLNRLGLDAHNQKALEAWLKFFNSSC